MIFIIRFGMSMVSFESNSFRGLNGRPIHTGTYWRKKLPFTLQQITKFNPFPNDKL